MIYIENLIEAEDRMRTAPSTFKNVLGDVYLLNKNKIYSGRRQMALTRKIKFKKSSDAYNMASLLCLPILLKSKTIPYSENKKVLEILSLPQKKITVDELVFLGFKKNNLMHETAHVIMWQTLQGHLDLSYKHEFMLAFLLTESYANYTEVIANIYAQNKQHIQFLSLNSFWAYSESEKSTLIDLYKKVGQRVTNTTLLLCFLYTNFLYKKMSRYECDSIRLFLNITANDLSNQNIKDLFKIANQLNIHFLMKTGEIFWKTLGINENLFESLDFDPVDLLIAKPHLPGVLAKLLAEDGLK